MDKRLRVQKRHPGANVLHDAPQRSLVQRQRGGADYYSVEPPPQVSTREQLHRHQEGARVAVKAASGAQRAVDGDGVGASQALEALDLAHEGLPSTVTTVGSSSRSSAFHAAFPLRLLLKPIIVPLLLLLPLLSDAFFCVAKIPLEPAAVAASAAAGGGGATAAGATAGAAANAAAAATAVAMALVTTTAADTGGFFFRIVVLEGQHFNGGVETVTIGQKNDSRNVIAAASSAAPAPAAAATEPTPTLPEDFIAHDFDLGGWYFDLIQAA